MSEEPARLHAGEQAVAIDDGFRHWYESCPCCLSQAYPEVKRALDEERQPQAPSPA